MTDLQQQLIDVLDGRGIVARFNGSFLNGSTTIKKANGKSQKQEFGIAFDDAAALWGPRVTRKLRGTYAEAFARDAFFEAIRLGQGEEETAAYVAECRETGVRSGASSEWLAAHDLAAAN